MLAVEKCLTTPDHILMTRTISKTVRSLSTINSTLAEDGELEDEPASLARLENVHIVSAEDIAAGLYSIEDVVLPLPGSQIIYPQNSTAEVYKSQAAKVGISLDAGVHKVKEFSLTALPGDYRRLLFKVRDLRWQLMVYSTPDEELGYTDLDALKGMPKPAVRTLDPGEELPEGKLLALQMSFQLPPSCYATMLVRELLKETTSPVQHRDRTLANKAANVALESHEEP